MQKRQPFPRRKKERKFKPLRNLLSLIHGVNLLMNKREFDEFFESYDAIFEKEMEKIIETGGYLDESETNKDSNKENSNKSKLFFNQKAPLFPNSNSKINANSEITSNETIFTNTNISPRNKKDNNNANNTSINNASFNNTSFTINAIPKNNIRRNSQSRSFLKQSEAEKNIRHLSMISLNPHKPERKKTLESSFLDSSGGNTIKSKVLEDITEDPLLEIEKLMLPDPKQQHMASLNPPGFEHPHQLHPSISTFRSDTSQLLSPPNVMKGDYEASSQSFTKLNMLKCELCDTENSILPSFVNINLKSNNNLERKDSNHKAQKDKNYHLNNTPPSLYLTNSNNASSNNFNNNNSSSSSLIEKKNWEFFLQMDVCGEFDIYLPHNNYTYVVEHLTRSKHIVKTLSLTSRILKVREEVDSADAKKKTAHFFNKP